MSKESSGNGELAPPRSAAVRASIAEHVGRSREHVEHARRDVGGRVAAHHARADQVEPEVAGAGADLQPIGERARKLLAERLAQLPRDLRLAHARRSRCPTWRRTARRRGRGSGRSRRGSPPVVVGGAMRRRSLCCRRVRGRRLRPAAASPTGCPRWPLTGERTLPDVPEENYWFRRHLAVYEWIAARCHGLDVVDMACGEGYGTDVLAAPRRAGHRGGRQPRGPRARRGEVHRGRACASCATWSTATPSPATPSSSSRRSSTWRTRRRVLRHFKAMLRPGGTVVRIHAERADAGARRGRRSPTTRGTSRSTGPRSSPSCARPSSARWSCSASSTPASCALHELALRAGWDSLHAALGRDQALLRPLHPGDLRTRLRAAPRSARARARLRRGAPVSRAGRAPPYPPELPEAARPRWPPGTASRPWPRAPRR